MKSIKKYILFFAFIFYPLSGFAQVQTSLPEDVAPLFIPEEPPPSLGSCPTEGVGKVTFKGFHGTVFNTYDYLSVFGRPGYNIGVFNASTAGWYHIYRMPTSTMADSGNHQRNETGFLSVPNGMNPGGKPHPMSAPQCNGWRLLMDIDNANPPLPKTAPPTPNMTPVINYGGTFYLNAGDNIVSLNHFCKLQKIYGGCDSYVDTIPTDDPSHKNLHGQTTECDFTFSPPVGYPAQVNSLGFRSSDICAIPEFSLPDPSASSPLPVPVMNNGDFSAGAIGSEPQDWVGVGEDGFQMEYNNYYISSSAAPDKFVIADDGGNKVLHADVNGGFYASHYVPNDIDKNWTDLSWRDYTYSGKFKFLESGVDRPRLFGLSVYSEFPYNTRALGLVIRSGDTAKIDVVNYIVRQYNVPGRTFRAGSDTDTGVIPLTDVYYNFKIEVTTPLSIINDYALPGQTVIKAKLWQEGSAEPSAWQADARVHHQSGSGSGAVGVLGFGVQGKGVYIDDLSVTPAP